MPDLQCPDIIFSIAFNHNGSRLVSGSSSWSGESIQIWSIDSTKMTEAINITPTYPVYTVAFSSDENLVVSTHKYQEINIWDSQSGDLLFSPAEPHVLTLFPPTSRSIWSANNNLLFATDHDINSWSCQNAKKGQILYEKAFKGHKIRLGMFDSSIVTMLRSIRTECLV